MHATLFFEGCIGSATAEGTGRRRGLIRIAYPKPKEKKKNGLAVVRPATRSGHFLPTKQWGVVAMAWPYVLFPFPSASLSLSCINKAIPSHTHLCVVCSLDYGTQWVLVVCACWYDRACHPWFFPQQHFFSHGNLYIVFDLYLHYLLTSGIKVRHELEKKNLVFQSYICKFYRAVMRVFGSTLHIHAVMRVFQSSVCTTRTYTKKKNTGDLHI
jgi:hypothetical protein